MFEGIHTLGITGSSSYNFSRIFVKLFVVLSWSGDVHVIWMQHGFSIKMNIIYDDLLFP